MKGICLNSGTESFASCTRTPSGMMRAFTSINQTSIIRSKGRIPK